MNRKTVTSTVLVGALAVCAAVVGVTSASTAQASAPAAAAPAQTSPVQATFAQTSPVQASLAPEADSSGLQVEVYKKEAGAGHRQFDYRITNTSAEPRVVEGAPDVATLFPSRSFVVNNGATYFSPNPAQTPLTLQPGQSAYGEIAWTAGASTGSTPGDLVVSWSAVNHSELDLGAVSEFPEGDYTATNLHTQPLS